MADSRIVPSRTIVPPGTVSDDMKTLIGAIGSGFFEDVPQSVDAWKAKIAAFSEPIEAALQVWEGQSHGQYMASITAPETRAYHDEVMAFLDGHLA